MIRSAAALILVSATLLAEEPRKFNATVNDFAFLAGHWRTSVWDGHGEEIWTQPESGNMIALWRFMKAGKLVFTEHVSLEDDAQRGPVLRLKHFNPGMKGWEEKDESVTFYLEKFEPGDASWAYEKDGKHVTIRYRKLPDDAIEATLVRAAAGKRDETVFRFTRVR